MSEPGLFNQRPLRERLRTFALIGYVAVCLVFVLPGGARLGSRAVWDSPHNHDQFAKWANTLSGLGIDTSAEALQQSLWKLTKRYLKTHSALMRPIAWIPMQLGFGQSWRMFSNPQTTPSRLWIEADSGNGFSPLYVSRSREHTWHRQFFEHHRVRKLFGRIGRGGRDEAYVALARWTARRAFRELPAAQRVRVRMYTWATAGPGPAPNVPNEPEFGRSRGKFRHEQVFERNEVGN